MAWAAAAFIIGTAVSVDASFKAASAAEEQAEVQSASQKIEDQSSLRKQAREARIQRARIAQAAETTGTTGGSKEAGALGSLGTQLAANRGRVAGQAQTADALTSIGGDISSARLQGAIGGAVSSVAASSFATSGGFDNLFKDV